jgi:hypothetical protein
MELRRRSRLRSEAINIDLTIRVERTVLAFRARLF